MTGAPYPLSRPIPDEDGHTEPETRVMDHPSPQVKQVKYRTLGYAEVRTEASTEDWSVVSPRGWRRER